jgi:hypothetical protein
MTVEPGDGGQPSASGQPPPQAIALGGAEADAAIHARYNLLRLTPAGTFLLALRHERCFIEIEIGRASCRERVFATV